MSRIHEALRKAQEERAIQKASVEVAPLQADESRVISSIGAAVAVETPLPSAVTPLQGSAGPLTYENVLRLCQRERWEPNASTLLFLNDDHRVASKEIFRTLRTRLYQIRDAQPLQTILVTSALPGEGKTFVCSNIAQSIIRQRERRAVLIDGDLRLSSLHKAFGAPSTPGLSDYLLGKADEFDILHRGAEENLFLIPGGKPVPNPAELLANGRIKTLQERLKSAFDWIIVDSPPVIPVSDSSLLADLCDGVIMVVRSGRTPLDAAQRACQQLAGRPLLGAILNYSKDQGAYSSYYYDYGQKKDSGMENSKS